MSTPDQTKLGRLFLAWRWAPRVPAAQLWKSTHVHYDFGRRETLWAKCYGLLQEQAEERIRQEVVRLGGSCAHVVDEAITAKTNDADALFWLRGRFRFVMYVHPPARSAPA